VDLLRVKCIYFNFFFSAPQGQDDEKNPVEFSFLETETNDAPEDDRKECAYLKIPFTSHLPSA